MALLFLGLFPGCGAPKEQSLVGSCVDGDETQQRYGSDCTCCHSEFGVAGSVDREGPPVARVMVEGAAGGIADMVPNEFGNFFRHLQLIAPLHATVFGVDGCIATMMSPAPHGGCNYCHDGVSLIRVRAP